MSEPKKIGRLVRVKNKKPAGNEKPEYLATHLEFPDNRGVHPVMFLPDELERPIKRAIRQQEDLPHENEQNQDQPQ